MTARPVRITSPTWLVVERAQAQVLDVDGVQAAMGDEMERLGDAIEAEHAAEVDAGDVAHDLERPLGGEHEIVAAAGRHDDRVQHLELAAAPLVRRLGSRPRARLSELSRQRRHDCKDTASGK